MADYRRGAHTVFEIHLHLVWITKYRRPALSGEVATRVRDLIRDICGQHEVNIMKGHVAKDHVHLFVSIPPQVTISRLLQWLKGKTAHHLMAEFPHIKKQFWGRPVLHVDVALAEDLPVGHQRQALGEDPGSDDLQTAEAPLCLHTVLLLRLPGGRPRPTLLPAVNGRPRGFAI